MARIRCIKPELLKDEKTATLSSDAWRLFVSALLMADDYGNLRATPRLIAAEVFWGVDGVDVTEAMDELERVGLVERYTCNGQQYAHVRGWEKHQKVDHPGAPLCPGPEKAGSSDSDDLGGIPRESLARTSRKPRETVAKASRVSRKIPEALAPDQDQDQDRDQDPPSGSSPDLSLTLSADPDPDQTRARVAPGVPEKAPEPAPAEKNSPVEIPARAVTHEEPLPVIGEIPSATDPATPHGLIHCLRVAVERVHPDRGFYNPGTFAARDAREFLENFQGRAADARAEITARIELFVADDSAAPWTPGKFARSYNAIGKPRPTRSAPEQDIRFGHARYQPSRDPLGEVKL